jgi:hypothetical protein
MKQRQLIAALNNIGLWEGGTMKKIALVLMVVIALGMIGEGLYSAVANLDIAQEATTAYTMADAYPSGMPNLVIDPCTHCALY